MAHSTESEVDWNYFRPGTFAPEHARLTGASLISPLWHPEGCAGMSGVYAVINAIQLALAGRHAFTSAELYALTSAGLRFMSGRLTPQQAVLAGLRVSLWRALAQAMVAVARRQTGVSLALERQLVLEAGCRAMLDAIEQCVIHLHVPMMLCRGGHYTVVKGFTPASLLLLDSGGACWMAKRSCGVPGDCDGARHVLYPGSLLAISS